MLIFPSPNDKFFVLGSNYMIILLIIIHLFYIYLIFYYVYIYKLLYVLNIILYTPRDPGSYPIAFRLLCKKQNNLITNLSQMYSSVSLPACLPAR